MASSAHSQNRLARLALALFVVAAMAGCGPRKLLRDDYYPAAWPEVVGAGHECRDVLGTFANKGALPTAAGAREIWFTDLFRVPPKVDEEKFSAMRRCERVRLSLETRTKKSLFREESLPRLVVTPSRKIDSDSREEYANCEGLQLPRGEGYPFSTTATPFYEGGMTGCVSNFLYYSIPGGTSGIDWEFGVDANGDLLVRITGTTLLWIPYVVPVFLTDHAWARFERLR